MVEERRERDFNMNKRFLLHFEAIHNWISNANISFINLVNDFQVRHAEKQIFVYPDFMDSLKTISNT